MLNTVWSTDMMLLSDDTSEYKVHHISAWMGNDGDETQVERAQVKSLVTMDWTQGWTDTDACQLLK
jgi:hypothetical protein